jgi:Flp pilus assembly protein TadD
MSCRLVVLCLAAVSAWGQLNRIVPITGRDTLSEEEFNSQSGFELRQQSPATTVSADQLRHPISRKAAKLLDQALSYSIAGNHTKAIEQLRLALKEPSAIPYAHSMLGAEYLWTTQIPAAVGELEEAVRLMPHEAANHSNLGFALYLAGQVDRGRDEVHQALALDVNNPKTRVVLGIVEQPSSSAR